MTETNTVVIAGAGGFIGRHLRRFLERSGVRVRTIGRSGADACWGGDLTGVLDGADALVNLAGRSVSCRYTKRNADAIFVSRTETTRELGEALARCPSPPSVWLNASTGTIYRDARDRPQSELDGQYGAGFSVAVARAWEHELQLAPVTVRRVALRAAFVLGEDGGVLAPLVNLARFGLGGMQGDGGQFVSWIHIDDFSAAVCHLIAHDKISGPVNLAAPSPVTNAELMAAVRRHFGGPIGARIGVPLPAWALELGSRIIRTETELVLKSRWVQPQVLLGSGFAFAFPTLDEALADLAPRAARGLLLG